MKKFLTIFAVATLVAFAAPAMAATNPFMDVPAGHWAYDAVAQLASRGIASGYPDGSYKGSQPATRYEMASMIARVLANVDMEKASKQDVELLKKLVLEFKNELDALGVKINDLDKRVAVLEDGIGGWHLYGIFQFDATFSNSNNNYYRYTEDGKKNEFTKERLRLYLSKTIDENSYFFMQYRTGNVNGTSGGRGDQNGGQWVHLYIDTGLPWDMRLRVGRFPFDFEGDYGLYIDNDALTGDVRLDGFRLKKSFGALDVTALVGRNIDTYDSRLTETNASGVVTYSGRGDYMTYMLDLHFQPSEKFFLGATGYWGIEDAYAGSIPNADVDLYTYAFYGGYSFTPNIALKGMYYFQDIGDTLAGGLDDSPAAWKAILDIKQEVLKFSSLWVEYSQQDNSFLGNDYRYAIGGVHYAHILENKPTNNETTKIWFIYAKQQWSKKFSTFFRYAQADYGTSYLDDSREYGLGVGYQYTPALYFELAYDQVDYGNNPVGYYSDKESVVRFRTSLTF